MIDSTVCKILCNIDKHAIFLRFSRLIKISERKNRMLLRTRSNSFRCQSDADHQTWELHKARQNKCVEGFAYCIIIAKSLVTFMQWRMQDCEYAFQILIFHQDG